MHHRKWCWCLWIPKMWWRIPKCRPNRLASDMDGHLSSSCSKLMKVLQILFRKALSRYPWTWFAKKYRNTHPCSSGPLVWNWHSLLNHQIHLLDPFIAKSRFLSHWFSQFTKVFIPTVIKAQAKNWDCHLHFLVSVHETLLCWRVLLVKVLHFEMLYLKSRYWWILWLPGLTLIVESIPT